ncbi:MAG: hypothetical protein GVY16_04520 [Planctomycetes bacterium]|jgi:uncharacterized membrane protein YdjX (TVP38/TMEM64 family)|nr:hypothetical protein [Planctomycetota bacterium]
MRLTVKVLIIALILAAAFLLTFAVWGDPMEAAFAGEGFAVDLADRPAVGWLMGLGLLVADLVLPVPATGVISALGTVYGFWLGWLISATGSTLAGLVGYGLVRFGGDRFASRLARREELKDLRHCFNRYGGVAIIASRALPVLPEVMAVLAGLARMRFRLFLAAILTGTIPAAGLFAWWGSTAGKNAPGISFVVAVVVPLGMWILLLPLLRHRTVRPTDKAIK